MRSPVSPTSAPIESQFTANAEIVVSPSMRKLLDQARLVAASDAPVLIEGETGTGKEILAEFIHHSSRRRARPLHSLNCAALSESLVESEIFGHERGAFTGAEFSRAGHFELAHEGTLLLDEIGEMPIRMQAKLLRILETMKFERVGGNRKLHVDVRILATTNRNLEAESRSGRFRRDLYYRLSVVRLVIPPLRNRPDDIPPLAEYFLQKFRNQGKGMATTFDPQVLEMLSDYSWPGNIRQLLNVVHHGCIMAQSEVLQLCDLPILENEEEVIERSQRPRTLAEIERAAIFETLQTTGGNKTEAARILGVTARTLFNKLAAYGDKNAA